jgi:predicted lipoprotein
MTLRASSIATAALAVALTVALASCVPWTVRPIDADQSVASGPAAASPVEYVDSIWASKLVPAVLTNAVEARSLLDALAASPEGAARRYGHHEANGQVYYLVKGEGQVTSIDTHSRVGLALVDIAPYDGRADISIQIGPVLRGTALRDATGLVHFSDFANQLQFADVANELNSRVLKTVLATLDPAQLKGRVVAFAGALAAPLGKTEVPLPELVPVQFKVGESR